MSDKSLIFSLFTKFKESGSEPPEETKEESREAGRPVLNESGDSRVETVEDWNEAERKKMEEFQEQLLEEVPETAGEAEDSPALEEAPEESMDASVELLVSEDKMSVSMMLYGPAGEGGDITAQMVEDALNARHICYGLDEKKIEEAVREKQYLQMLVIARGTPAENGSDGRIRDHFPRKAQIKYASKENGAIDFKGMNLIHNVKAGEVICELTNPTEAQDGTDVFGQPVRGKKGTMPPIPQGKNVVYSAGKDKLIAACEGNLTFRSGRFHVENVFAVAGNVDNSVGNIDFTGSVVVHGDVFEGYTVKAKGDITVMGIVEGATLKAGGNILLHKGMRGMKSGILEAEEDITAKFLEDCTITAGNDIQAEYIINSDVSCGHNLTLTGKRGAVIGGSCAVFNRMDVRAVGTPSHVATYVALGVTPQMMNEMEQLGKELAEITKRLSEIQKDISYLNGRKRDGAITDIQKERLTKRKLELSVAALKEKRLKEQTTDISRKLREVGKARLTVLTVHPGTVLTIGDSRLNITKKEDNCSFYYLDGEIRKGIR